MFSIYLQLGFEHISDWQGYDHILFIVVLCAIYKVEQWKQILILVTAFTIGHSLTLALSSLEVIQVNMEWVEFLIPVTILITALLNIINVRNIRHPMPSSSINWNYGLALFVGLIHGLGFSNFFKALEGQEELISKLLAFNIGLELGQLMIVLGVMLVAYLVLNVLKIQQKIWTLFISGATGSIALYLAIERWIF